MDRRTMMIALALIGAGGAGCEGTRAARAEPTTQASAVTQGEATPSEIDSEPPQPKAIEVVSADAPLAAESERAAPFADSDPRCAMMRSGACWRPDEEPRARVRRRGAP